MIRTGYLRWEIEAEDVRSQVDARSREVVFLARPTHRIVRVKTTGHAEAAGQFARGDATYDAVLRTLDREGGEVELTIPDVGPHTVPLFRGRSRTDGSLLDGKTPARGQRVRPRGRSHRVVVLAACHLEPRSPRGLRPAGRGRIFRVIEGKSKPQPTSNEPIVLDANVYQQGVPELVAAELVRDVVEPKEFHEFCQFDCITVKNGDNYYRIPRRPHALIEVWEAATRRPVARLCVVFQDPGMPPSDEVVMKYLLAKHQPDLLWQTGVRFSPPDRQVRGDAAAAVDRGLTIPTETEEVDEPSSGLGQIVTAEPGLSVPDRIPIVLRRLRSAGIGINPAGQRLPLRGRIAVWDPCLDPRTGPFGPSLPGSEPTSYSAREDYGCKPRPAGAAWQHRRNGLIADLPPIAGRRCMETFMEPGDSLTRVVILGSTGSIGRNTLSVIEHDRGRARCLGFERASELARPWSSRPARTGRFVF